MAIFVASDIFLQSMSQKRAETVVVNETQSLTKVNGVDPVTSSHWARDGPPKIEKINQEMQNIYCKIVNKIMAYILKIEKEI